MQLCLTGVHRVRFNIVQRLRCLPKLSRIECACDIRAVKSVTKTVNQDTANLLRRVYPLSQAG